VTRAGGGGGGADSRGSGPTAGTGGTGGGANGTISTSPPANATANLGGGGGGGTYNGGFVAAGNGGSGVVILKYPSAFTITVGAGLTGSTSTVGDNKVTTITQGTGNVSFA
jgi:hypothetical protein